MPWSTTPHLPPASCRLPHPRPDHDRPARGVRAVVARLRRRRPRAGRGPRRALRPGRHLDQPFGTLSAGERRRTSIARALMPDPTCSSSTSRRPASTWRRASACSHDLARSPRSQRPTRHRPRLAPSRGDPARVRARARPARRSVAGGRADRRRAARRRPDRGLRPGAAVDAARRALDGARCADA